MLTTSSGIRDNRKCGAVADYLREIMLPDARLSFVSAYFTIHAFKKMQAQFEQSAELRFLFGEPSFLSNIDPDRTDKRAFSLAHDKLDLTNQLKQKIAARDCAAFFARDSVEIRSVVHPDFLHGKLFHARNGNSADAILGSSNFTVRGLGLGAKTSNLELNLIVDSKSDMIELKDWFDEVWKDKANVTDVKAEVLGYLSKLYADNSPRELYYKTLIHVLENSLSGQSDGELFGDARNFTGSALWKALYSFQKDGVRAAINKIKKYNGCIIADSVGLGKTFEALGVIKYFELKGQKVLVLCPKRLRENWTVYLSNSHNNPFPDDKFGYTVLSHTDLSRDSGTVGIEDLASFNWGQFGLVVIDESHNFRNNARGRKRADGTYLPSRYERLMDQVIQSGARTQVLLLSATPVNNDLKDLRNQIYLMSGDDDGAYGQTLGLASVKDTLAAAQRSFNAWADDPQTRHNPAALYGKLTGNFFSLLDGLTIARSRGHIQRHYAETLDSIGHFPTREKPIAVFPHIDNQSLFLSFENLDEQISKYQLALFKPSTYLKEEHAALYANKEGSANFSQEKREKYLIGMMKVNFLKRLESSIASFAISMQRTIDKIGALEAKIAAYKARADVDLSLFSVEDEVEESEESDAILPDAEELTVGKGLQYQLRHMRLDDWLTALRADKQQLHSLLLQARDVSPARDDKLDKLKAQLRARIEAAPADKDGRGSRKAIVFTAFSDTADYLFDQLKDWARDELGIHVAKVTGGAKGTATTLGKLDFNEILTNFSPRSKKRNWDGEEIDLLIATDCISEGQNLQDCGYLVNYDIHWNPVRLIQRFGRIDRIGSRFGSIQMVNFWPIEDLNRYINLKSRVESRMALADISATAGDNPLSAPQVGEELKYRDEQLLKLRDKVLDIEELEDVSLGDFSLEDFRLELLDHLEKDSERLRALPLGMYAVVKSTPKWKPGAVFCLRANAPVKADAKRTNINPTAPYYLLYVERDDGSDSGGEIEHTPHVAFGLWGNDMENVGTSQGLFGSAEKSDLVQPKVTLGFAQANAVLAMLRELCADRIAPDEALCEAFANVTDDGHDMSVVDELVSVAVKACGEELQSRALSGLTQRGAQLMNGGAKAQTNDFELVTWFVLV